MPSIKAFIFTLLVLIATGGHSSGQNGSDTRDGSSYERAIIAKSSKAEYKKLAEFYPGYKTKSQSLSKQGKRYYNIWKIITKEGTEKNVYVDITKFHGKSLSSKKGF